MFQETTGIGDMIADLHAIVSDEAEEQEQLTYLHRLR
jgi:iron complex transport system substrate-binding protein